MTFFSTMAEAGHSHQVLTVLPRSNDNVTATPTAAEITTAFGSPPDGFAAILDDAGAGTAVWLILRKNAKWWFVSMTAAV